MNLVGRQLASLKDGIGEDGMGGWDGWIDRWTDGEID